MTAVLPCCCARRLLFDAITVPTNPGNAKDLDVLGASGAVNYALR